MQIPVYWLLLMLCFAGNTWAGVQEEQGEQLKQLKTSNELLEKPLIERYILDELKALRQEQQNFRIDMADRVANSRVEATDRSVRYATDTVNNIFYIITAAATLLLLFGWRSMREIKENVESVIEERVAEVTQEYESRLEHVEKKLKVRSEQIIANQEEIAQTNQVHSLWMRAGLEQSAQEKVNIYDEILGLKPDDVEVLSYKADAVLEIGEAGWALNLSNQAIEKDAEYAFAYWQRACAKAELGQEVEALQDIRLSIEKSPALQNGLLEEAAFKCLHNNPEFEVLVPETTIVSTSP